MPDTIVERIIREMSLREPQADSLRKLTNLLEAVDLPGQDQARVRRLLETGPLRFTDPYARLSFALATGVGKTRLMGAIMAWLYLTKKSQHFVLLAPSSTIYRKMQYEAVPTHPKYLFAGLAPFPLPEVITADAVESWDPQDQLGTDSPTLFVLTPGQIRPRSGSEVERRLRRDNERLGESFVTHLTKLPDLIAFLDEGHRYGQDTTRERAWAQAIADLTPKLVIEMTATPSNPTTILYRYDLADALREGRYIKNVMAIVQQRTQAITEEEWDHLTLREGLRRLEAKKNSIAALRVNQPERKQVKPIMLVACRDTTHSQAIERWFQSRACEGGRYQGKVLRVDITQSEEEIAKLLEVENPDNPTEIVVNVGMLREGWDVENVYVVVPLRATVSETLAIQTIGRGLRLPYGSRVDDQEVDTLDVLAFGRETVQQVIEAAKALGASARPSGPSGAHADYKQHEVHPSRKVSLSFPTFGHRVVDPPTLRGFRLAPQVSADPNQQPTVTLVDVPTGDVQQVEALVAEGILNFPKRFAQLLVRVIPEVGGQEKEAVRLFEDYFRTLGCRDVESQRRMVQSRGADILQDAIRQVHEVVARAKEELEETQDTEACVFRPVTLSAPVKVLDCAQAQLPRDAAHLISGWKHSLYPCCRFDTAQEFQIAKILDGAAEISWIRNPVSQFAFVVSSGKHFPDFVALEKHRIVFIESKDARELRDPNSEACRIGKEATEQCHLASQASKTRWEYWAIPHDQVERCATFQDLAGQRFRFSSQS